MTVGVQPWGVAVHPAGNGVYVSNTLGPDQTASPTTVSVIDVATNTVIANIPSGVFLRDIALNPSGTRAYVALSDWTLAVIDTATNSVVTTIPVGFIPYGVDVSPDGNRVYVTNENCCFGPGVTGSVSIIDAATNSVVATVTVGEQPTNLKVSPDSSRVYVVNGGLPGNNTVSVIDTVTNTVIATVPVGPLPWDVALNSTGTRAYVSITNTVGCFPAETCSPGSVAVIDTATNSIVTTIPVGVAPFGLVMAPDGQRLYVANTGSHTISAIDINTNSIVATIPVTGRPWLLAMLPPSTNQVPTANANGPYSVPEGSAITLTGTGADPDGDPVTFAWDLDNNGSFETAGQVVTFSAAGLSGGTSRTVTLRVCDDNGTCATATATINILTVVTIVTPSLPAGTVGVPYTAMLEATGGTQPYSWSIEPGLGDLPAGLTLNATTGVISGTPTAAGVFAFTVRVTDSSQITTIKRFTVTPPPPSGGSAGTPYPSTPIVITPPTSDPTTPPPTCSNYVLAPGSDPLPPGMSLNPTTGVLSGTPLNGGTYNLIVQCTYNTNQTATKDFTITINNPAPVLVALNPAMSTEGDPDFTLTVNGSGFVTASVARWNGSDRPTTYVSTTQLTVGITAADIATAGTASVTVFNPGPGGGTSNAKPFEIKPRNRPPAATLAGDSSANEGDTKTYTFTVTDPDPGDTFTIKPGFPDCGVGILVAGSLTTTATGGSFRCSFPDGPAVVTVRIQVRDSKGADSDVASLAVSAANIAPTPVISGAPTSSPEGTPISLTAAATDPSSPDTAAGFTFTWSVTKNGTSYGSGGTGPTFSVTPNDNGAYVVTLKARDKDGSEGTTNATITVTSVAPTVIISGPASGALFQVGTPVTVTGSFTYPGTADTHTATVMFDSLTVAGTVSETNGSGSVTATYTFTVPGVYSIKLTVTDDDGGVGEATTIGDLPAYIVVFDPNGGFVTGGGWITSPVGACQLTTVCQGTTGKATFGFVSKYQPGATGPTGQTEFQFKAGDLNFHSTSYQWLVVAGAKAKFKGEGTINGQGNYGFMISAIDGQAQGSGGVDKFRIKIWDKNDNDRVVYDNQLGSDENADPTTALGGGSIVVHKE